MSRFQTGICPCAWWYSIANFRRYTVATPNYGYEKRQKELAKKRKKEEKLKEKSERKAHGESNDRPNQENPAPENQPG